jgi:hypothetical protein
MPNPNSGSFSLKQLMTDDNPVRAEIWNVAGEIVYKGQLQFGGGVTKLQMNGKTPGLYLLQLMDSGGNVFIIKFVISN